MSTGFGRSRRVLGRADYPLREQIRDELRSRISCGKLAPGDRLVEQTLADEFGVSRIPVREALRLLESEGLIDTRPRSGVIVRTFNKEDLEHLFDVRAALEAEAFRLAAQRATPADILHLERLMEQTASEVGSDNHAEVAKLNLAFHEAITQMARNPFLSSMLEPLTGQLGLLIGQSHEHERQLYEHSTLVEAIRNHDPDLASAAAFTHVRRSRTRALAHFGDKAEQTSA